MNSMVSKLKICLRSPLCFMPAKKILSFRCSFLTVFLICRVLFTCLVTKPTTAYNEEKELSTEDLPEIVVLFVQTLDSSRQLYRNMVTIEALNTTLDSFLVAKDILDGMEGLVLNKILPLRCWRRVLQLSIIWLRKTKSRESSFFQLIRNPEYQLWLWGPLFIHMDVVYHSATPSMTKALSLCAIFFTLD